MSIIKRVPDNIGFTMISNDILQNEGLSLTARGLLAYLLSKPPDWKINVSHMLEQFPESKPRVSRAWQELKENGYVRKIQLREKGKIAGWDYEVSQGVDRQDTSVSRILENNNLADKNLASKNLAGGCYINKENTNQRKTKKEEDNPLTPRGGNQTATPLASDLKPEEKERKPRVGNLDLPSWLTQEDWKDYVEHRRAIKKPMTPRAGELMIGRLKKIAAEHGEQAAQEALLNSIAGGWIGVFPPKPQNAPTAPTSTGVYLNANDKNQSLINSWLEEENGNKTDDREGAANMGSQHRPSDSNRSAGSLAADLPGRTGRAVCGSTETAPARDAGEAVSDSWADLGITAQPAAEHGVLFSN